MGPNAVYVHAEGLGAHGTSGGREFDVVDFTEADGVDGRGVAVVAEPV